MATEATVNLREWEHIELNDAQRAALHGVGPDEVQRSLAGLVSCQMTPRGLQISADKRNVGEARVGALHVRVAPRLPVGDVVRLFAWTRERDLKLLAPALGAASVGTSSFAEVLAAGLVVEAERILAGDLHRAWRRREERLLLLRGRPAFERMGAAPAALGVACRYLEGTHDTRLNRLLAVGTGRAARLLYRHTGWLRRARAVAQAMLDLAPGGGEARPLSADFAAGRAELTPRTQGYRSALWLAEWIAVGGGPLTTAGAGGPVGWRLDMAALFEAAVTRSVRRELEPLGFRVDAQARDRTAILDGGGKVYREVRPDIEVRDGAGAVIAILDAKYKTYGQVSTDGAPAWKVENDDLYQLAFYGARFPPTLDGRPPVQLAIVSPSDPDAPPLGETWTNLSVGGQPLRLVAVDVARLPDASPEQRWVKVCVRPDPAPAGSPFPPLASTSAAQAASGSP